MAQTACSLAVSGRAGFTNYMMRSSRMSFLIPGDGSNVQVNCWRSGVWHRSTSSGHSTLRDDKWHELFFVIQGSTVTLYVDGKSAMSNGGCNDWKANKWRFGNHAAEFSKMSLWKRTLSSSEIADGKMLCKDDEDLVSRYQLADATDEKGNGNDLEMNGGSFVTSDYGCQAVTTLISHCSFRLKVLTCSLHKMPHTESSQNSCLCCQQPKLDDQGSRSRSTIFSMEGNQER